MVSNGFEYVAKGQVRAGRITFTGVRRNPPVTRMGKIYHRDAMLWDLTNPAVRVDFYLRVTAEGVSVPDLGAVISVGADV